MTRWRWSLVAFVSLLVLGVTVTGFNIQRPVPASLVVELGIPLPRSEAAVNVDQAVISSFDAGLIGRELRMRLDKPSRLFKLEQFLLDRCEVTQKSFESFVQWRTDNATRAGIPPSDNVRSLSSGNRIAGRLQSPATGVALASAQMYCATVGGRLPFVEELEAAASGQEGRLYPWGNEFRRDPWPYKNADRNANQQCSSQPSNTTPSGVAHLVSNAMEWTQGSLVQQGDQQPIAFGAPAVRTRARELYALNAAWLAIEPGVESHHLGFRCVYDQFPRPSPWDGSLPEFVAVPGDEYALGMPPDAQLPGFVANLPTDANLDLDLAELVADEGDRPSTLRIDRCEVSRAQYARFLNDPLVQLGLHANEREPLDTSYTPLDWDQQRQALSLPVYGMNWWAANAYARWAGGRLPTVSEWRKVALGTDANQYPWGDDYVPNVPTIGDSEESQLTTCGTASVDRTRHGVLDLGGNLSEWTRSIAIEKGVISARVQGGNWLLPGAESAQSAFSRSVPLEHRGNTIGMRIVYDN